ncbi:hypothetical protein LguiA_008718 [Lonicera macranthoides]
MANNSQFTGLQPPRPPIAPLGPPQNSLPSMPMQFRPVGPPQQPPSYIPVVASQQFLPVGRTNIGMPSHTQQPQFSQSMQQLPARPGQVGHILPPAQTIPVPDVLPNRPLISVSPQPQQTSQVPSNYMPGLAGPRMPLPSSYSLSASSGGQIQINMDATSQYQPMPQTNVPSFPTGGQPWQSGSQVIQTVMPVQQTGEQISVVDTVPATLLQPGPVEKVPSDWIEHTARNGKIYYYNKRTRLSSWEKPLELMTAIERADASTDWREVTSPDGRKYYYNRVTKQSKWLIPDELKLARQQLTMESIKGTQESSKAVNFQSPAAEVKASPPSPDGSSSAAHEVVVSSPVPVEPVVAAVNPESVVTDRSSTLPPESSSLTTNANAVQIPLETAAPSSEISVTLVNTVTAMNDSDNVSSKEVVTAADGVSAENIEEARQGTSVAEMANITAAEEKTVDQEPLVYENKQEAKNAFRALLETADIVSDWTWDQAMRVIINDQRYGALRTLGERKQVFNEFLGQKRKQEAEERRIKQKKGREDFKKMLEESKELISSTRWSKAISVFEDDERFIAVERAKDREDLFEDYILELEKKERAKAAEENRRNRAEYIEFLKSCDFIKASSQWRKVQDRLEADERCSRLEKIDRLEIFQEYLRDLEKEEEEQRKLRMEEVRKTERKNRDEFRKLMEGHITAGTLTAKTHWRDYCMKVKELPAYLAVSSNTSGATPKDLFEDVAEELQKQHLEDKDRIKDAVKLGKITMSSTSSIEDFKAAILQDISSPPVSNINLKLVFDELQEKAREREEKEAKKRKRQGDDFYESLCSFKDISASSRWEDCKVQFEDRQESWFNEDESFFREIFEKYITELKEKAREKERRRREEKDRKDKEGRDREKRKQRRDKERGKGKERHRKDETDSENDRAESYSFEDIKRSGRDKDRKHRKRHHSSFEDLSLVEDEQNRSKNFHRHSIDRKRSKQVEQYAGAPEADYENRNKRHKRDHKNGSHRNSDHEEQQKEKDFAEDGEVW